MDAKLTVPVPPGVSLDKACTLGVATYVSVVRFLLQIRF
jgi:hypothetical protein